MAAALSTVSPETIVYGINHSELSWNSWTSWTECTASCAGGQMLRLMLCEGQAQLNQCPHHLLDARNFALETSQYETAYDLEWMECSTFPCPIDGYWTQWLPWTECSASCDTGTRLRQRACIGPSNNGLKCPGAQQENEFCLNSTCATGSTKTRVLTFQEEQENIRYKESDHRTSAIGTGVLSLIFLLVELGLIISIDAVTLTQQISFCIRNLKHFAAAIKKFKYHRGGHRVVATTDQETPNSSPGKLSQVDG
ncbi:hypothetical protein CAPTEDRAFT_227515 [Capitella teleta]|uniref:ADAMTS cysteine-rich domain-containing protein n=1 Tax=Capitella teleta TaxID=283909 RepID=R7UIY4_CAPTE|nr:hypothetical protein CAPTEDRAFT_227515 [Capitella teleta]|eukprot:ELU06140.1 hypothetical protein CAPTEDRAFT_227515 [Capitella teleta]